MGKISWKTTAAIGLFVFSQAALAAPGDRVTMVAGNSAHPEEVSQPDPTSQAQSIAGISRDFDFTRNQSGAQFDMDGAVSIAQAGEPAASATPPPPDSKGPDQSTPANASPAAATSTAAVARAAPSATGCGLKYLAAELAGKLKGRKWKEFREEECGPGTSQAVFPSAIAPKYSGESPDKARTHTCADQFSANKATNGNDGLKWIEKGGGYYSECISRLKG